MPGKAPAGIGGAGYDAAQTGVGVDERVPVQRDAEVELTWPNLPHRDIARREGTLCRGKAAGLGQGGKTLYIAAAQGIAVGDWGRTTCPFKRHGQHADAVKPGVRIASVQAKAAAEQHLCCRRQLRAGHDAGEG